MNFTECSALGWVDWFNAGGRLVIGLAVLAVLWRVGQLLSGLLADQRRERELDVEELRRARRRGEASK